MKRAVVILLALSMLLCLAACRDKIEDEGADSHSLYGCYTFGDHPEMFMNFQLTLMEDGRFTYYATPLSSYIGYGNYVIEDDIITLTDDGSYGFVNHFRIKNGKLIFIADGSSNFMYVKLKNGDAFEYAGEFRGTGFYGETENATE